ncbi:hypothetical protein [Halorussus lipolyticus]|uniref:hypothetical protein n=1 Tax=Halorussus lipolyticus TaxID=3034024 RepID=UPI0023E7CAF7|nr:hypothetical protein [Halorussus sp. DT80]
MDRRTFLRWSTAATGVFSAGCTQSGLSPPSAPPRTETYGRERGDNVRSISTRSGWLSGQFDGTQATLSGTLALDDQTVLEDDFT